MSVINHHFRLSLAGAFLLLTGGAPVAGSVDGDLSIRPGIQDGPTIVRISCALTDIHDVDDVSQSVEASMAIFLTWKDPRLAHAGTESVYRALDSIWDPGIIVLNGGEYETSGEHRVEIQPDGTVMLERYFRGRFDQKFDLRRFPFDRQTLAFTFLSFGHHPEELVLKADPDNPSRINPDLSISNWTILGWDTQETLFRLVETAPGRAVFRMTIDAQRETGFFIFKVIVPLILIMFMSWLVYWIHPSKVDAQIGVGATSILTLIAFRFTVDGLLPEIPYLTRLDSFILLSMVMVFANLIESVATAHLHMSGRETLAVKIDRHGRWIYLILLAAVVVFTLLV